MAIVDSMAVWTKENSIFVVVEIVDAEYIKVPEVDPVGRAIDDELISDFESVSIRQRWDEST